MVRFLLHRTDFTTDDTGIAYALAGKAFMELNEYLAGMSVIPSTALAPTLSLRRAYERRLWPAPVLCTSSYESSLSFCSLLCGGVRSEAEHAATQHAANAAGVL
jgi:hypothetical protein